MKIPFPVRALPKFALQAWFTPPPLGRRAARADLEAVEGLQPVSIPDSSGSDLVGFEVGSGPLVLAIHGWGGRAAQMAPMARRIAEDGFRVVAVDLPGHAGGEVTDIKATAGAIQRMVEVIGPPQAVVGHSFAGATLRLAFPDAAPTRVVMLAPMIRVSDAFDVFARRARLLPWTRRGLWKGLVRWDPVAFPKLDDLSPDQLPGAEVLILHDPEDADTSFLTAARLAAHRPGTIFVPLAGVGHAGILTDPLATDLVVDFVGTRLESRDSVA